MNNIETEGFVKQREALERLLMTQPAMEKKVQTLIRKVLTEARKTIAASASSKMRTDPRQAYKAVKTSVYRQVLGGNVSLYSHRRRMEGASAYEPPRTLRPGQRGGNRVPRSQRTEDLMSYQGADRAFVLRFLEGGINEPRTAGSRGGRIGGNRGTIGARNFFGSTSQSALQKAADQLDTLIGELIQKEFDF